MRKMALVGILLLAAGRPALGQGKTDPKLNELAAAFAAAFNAKDAAGVAAFYTDDAVVMAPNVPMLKGRSDIEAYYKQGFSQGGGTMRLHPFESAASGSVAFEAGTSTLTIGNPSGQLLPGAGGGGRTEAGKYVVIYKRVKNEWKIAFDIFNNDAPPPPTSR
jgi:ketosteroid isomerase-like protein